MYNLRERCDGCHPPGSRILTPERGLFSTEEDLRHVGQMMLNCGLWKGQKLLCSQLGGRDDARCVRFWRDESGDERRISWIGFGNR
jgi:CubicO group peptidase (beta-lactamase class C family)